MNDTTQGMGYIWGLWPLDSYWINRHTIIRKGRTVPQQQCGEHVSGTNSSLEKEQFSFTQNSTGLVYQIQEWNYSCTRGNTYFDLISKDPMTQCLLKIEKSFCNDKESFPFIFFSLQTAQWCSDRYRSNGFNKLKNWCFPFYWLWGSLDVFSRTSQNDQTWKIFFVHVGHRHVYLYQKSSFTHSSKAYSKSKNKLQKRQL
jgi:hypothetical protein